MFVQTDRIAVSDGSNTIFVRRKMDVGAVLRVQGAEPSERLMTLYIVNVLDWSGPAFAGVPCTPENIARLDPNEPLVEMVGDKIAELNPKKDDASPLPSTTAGVPSTTENGKTPAATTTSTSHSRKSTAGRPSR